MRKSKILVLTAIAVTTLGLIAGCNNKNKSQDIKSEKRIVKSVKGDVEIPSNPNRIVDISGSTEELVLLGYKPVGTANVDSYDKEKVPNYMRDKLSETKVVGHSMMDTMDIEGILGLKPDLIIMAPRQEKMYDELKKIAPVVMTEDFNNDWKGKLKSVGKLFDKEDKVNSWLTNYEKEAKKLGEEIKKENKDRTYLTILASSGKFYVFSNAGIGTMLSEDMELPQSKNMPKQDNISLPTVTIEGLTAIDADHLVVIGTESDKADLKSSTVWSEIKAVKDGNVTMLDSSPYFSQSYNPIGRELLLQPLKENLVK